MGSLRPRMRIYTAHVWQLTKSLLEHPSVKRLIPALSVTLLSLGIYAQLIGYDGYLSWGNFGTPLTLSFSQWFLPGSLTWSNPSSFGSPVLEPWIFLLDWTYYPTLLLLGGFWSTAFATKSFIVLVTIFDGLAFYKLAGCFTRSLPARLLSSLFVLGNPVTIYYVMSGLFSSLLWLGVYFLSVWLLSLFVRSNGRPRFEYAVGSTLLLASTAANPMLFYLGLPLYILFTAYFTLVSTSSPSRGALISFLRSCAMLLGLVALFSAPLAATLLFGSYNVTPGSSLAHPLNDFALGSTNFVNMMTLNSYSFSSLGSLIPYPALSVIWVASVIGVSVVILGGGMLVRDARTEFLVGVALIGGVLGSGYYSPIPEVTIFLYQHLYGYQVLNDSYVWGEFVIVPCYGLVMALLLDRISSKWSAGRMSLEYYSSGRLRRGAPRVLAHPRKSIMSYLIVGGILILVLVPVTAQAYYGPNGIHQSHVPPGYVDLQTELESLVGSSDVGVALFPPDLGVSFGNASGGSINPLALIPTVRYAVPVTYGGLETPSSYYFTWLYNQFYSNATPQVATLMGLEGVKYFVTLNNVNHDSTNMTRLMGFQNYVKLIYASRSYSIFVSTIPVDVASAVGGLTLVPDSFDSLSAIADLGLNLTSLPMAFFSDLNSGNFNMLFNMSKGVVFANSQGWLSLAIQRYINATDSINPWGGQSSYDYNIDTGWVQSQSLYEWPETIPVPQILSSPLPFWVTTSTATLHTIISAPTRGKYVLCIYAFNSPVIGSSLNVTVGSEAASYSTDLGISNATFSWIPLTFNFSGSPLPLKIAPSGLNGIQSIVVLNETQLTAEESRLVSYSSLHSWKVLNLSSSNLSQEGQAVSQINAESANITGLNFDYGANSYTISGNLGGSDLVRLNYFASMAPHGGRISLVPILGGMSYLVVGTQGMSSVTFVSTQLSSFTGGLIIYATVLVACAVVIIRTRCRRRTSN